MAVAGWSQNRKIASAGTKADLNEFILRALAEVALLSICKTIP
jgi:hypothetical protein